MGHLGLHLVDEVLLGLLHGEAGDLLQHRGLALLDELDLLVLAVHGRVLLGQGLFLLLHGLGLAVQVLFLLLQAVLLPLQIGSAGLLFLLVLAAAAENLFLGLQQHFLFLGLGALDGIIHDAKSFLVRVGDLRLRLLGFALPIPDPEKEARHAADHQADDGIKHGLAYLLFFHGRSPGFVKKEGSQVPSSEKHRGLSPDGGR